MAQVAGLPLLLPAYARPDLAFELDVAVPGGLVNFFGEFVLWTGEGQYVDVPLTVVFSYTTVAALGDRTVGLALTNQDGVTLWHVPAPATQPAGTTYSYTWSPLLVSAVGPAGGTIFSTPFPPSMMYPDYELRATVSNHLVGERFAAIAVGVQRYPTGPRPETTLAPAVATPVLA